MNSNVFNIPSKLLQSAYVRSKTSGAEAWMIVRLFVRSLDEFELDDETHAAQSVENILKNKNRKLFKGNEYWLKIAANTKI